MSRLLALVFYANSLLLTGCLRTTESPPAQTLVPIYKEKYSDVFDSLEYSNNGQTLVATGMLFASLYNSTDHKKLVEVKADLDSNLGISRIFMGAGHIDDNTWYFATSIPGENLIVDIRQIVPARDLVKYDIGHDSNRPILANRNHVTNGMTLLNWHDGKRYKVDIEVGAFGYTLTENSRVMTYNPIISNTVLVHDPVRQEHLQLDTGSRVGEVALSADAKYAITVSRKGHCVVWYIPEKRKTGSCGRTSLINSKQTFRPDGRSFRVLVNDEIREYETHTLKLLSAVPLRLKMPATIISLAMNDNWLAALDEKGHLRAWSLVNGMLRGEYVNEAMAGYDLGGSNLAFQPHGNRLAVSQSTWLIVFDLGDPPAMPEPPREQGNANIVHGESAVKGRSQTSSATF